MGTEKGFRGLVPGTSKIVVILDEVDVQERNVEWYNTQPLTPHWLFLYSNRLLECIILLKC